MLVYNIKFIYFVIHKKIMKEEEHKEAFEIHRSAIFTWVLEIEGLEKSQKIIGLHASRGIIELLSLFLHKKKLVSEGFQLNHRWFKSEKVFDKLPDFDNKWEIVEKIIKLENICKLLSYGKKKPLRETEEVIRLFKELEELINKLL